MRYSSFWRQDIFHLATLHKVVEWTFSKGGALCYKFLTWRASTMAPVCVPVFMETLASGICELSWNLHIDANLKFKNCIDFNKNIKIISQRLRGGGFTLRFECYSKNILFLRKGGWRTPWHHLAMPSSNDQYPVDLRTV